jgi:hypothetical protein
MNAYYEVTTEKGSERMQTVINIYSLKINNVSNNGSINIGEALHNSPTANTKSQGQNASYGDYAPPTAAMENVFIDPDMNDMGDIANPSPVISNQM